MVFCIQYQLNTNLIDRNPKQLSKKGKMTDIRCFRESHHYVNTQTIYHHQSQRWQRKNISACVPLSQLRVAL
jgi:virulence-associated protein VapD